MNTGGGTPLCAYASMTGRPPEKISGEAKHVTMTLDGRTLLEQEVHPPLNTVFGAAERGRIKATVPWQLQIGAKDLDGWWAEVRFAGLAYAAEARSRLDGNSGEHAEILLAAKNLFGKIHNKLEREVASDAVTPLHDTLGSVAVLIAWMERFAPDPRSGGRPADYSTGRFVGKMAELFQSGFGRAPSMKVDRNSGSPRPSPFARFVIAVASDVAPDLPVITPEQVNYFGKKRTSST